MKKIVNIITIFLVLFMSVFAIKVYAASLDSIDITTDKQTVHPGETVKVNVAFGKDLGAYTVDVAYDSNLLEYVSAEGGTANDNGTRIRVLFHDETGGSNPRNNMSVTFRAKTEILTSNPTDLSITAEGLTNPDASVSYDDINIPIVKNIVVEPEYVDYNIAFNYTGDIIKNEEKDIKIIISSTMGKNYEHTRIIAEATTPTSATVKLLAKDQQGLEHDIIQSGWGDASGDAIGGKDVMKQLDVKGLFSEEGNYSITLKLINRDDSDAVIASKTFQVAVKSETITPPTTEPEPENPSNNNQTNNGQTNNGQTNNGQTNNNTTIEEEQPTKLPQTGNTAYLAVISILVLLTVVYVRLRTKE